MKTWHWVAIIGAGVAAAAVLMGGGKGDGSSAVNAPQKGLELLGEAAYLQRAADLGSPVTAAETAALKSRLMAARDGAEKYSPSYSAALTKAIAGEAGSIASRAFAAGRVS